MLFIWFVCFILVYWQIKLNRYRQRDFYFIMWWYLNDWYVQVTATNETTTNKRAKKKKVILVFMSLVVVNSCQLHRASGILHNFSESIKCLHRPIKWQSRVLYLLCLCLDNKTFRGEWYTHFIDYELPNCCWEHLMCNIDWPIIQVFWIRLIFFPFHFHSFYLSISFLFLASFYWFD